MPGPEENQVVELLARVLRRQDEIDARFLRIEAALGLELIVEPSAVAVSDSPSVPLPTPPEPSVVEAALVSLLVEAAPVSPAVVDAAPGSSAAVAAAPAAPVVATPEAPVSAVEPGTPLAATRAVPEPTTPTLESRVGLAWLNRIGVVTLILGVGFAFKTAVDNNWLGPTARVVLGIAVALATLVAGDVSWRRRQAVFAQGLTGLGLALLYLAFWAVFALYHLVPQELAFGLMVATTIASALLAIRYDGQAIAVLAMIGGYITPVVLSSGESHPLIFLGYITLLNAGGFALARKRGWPALEYLAAAATGVLYAGWWSTSFTLDDRPIASLFAVVFYAQFSSARPRLLWQIAQPLGPLVVAALWDDPNVLPPLLFVFAAGGLVVAELRRWPEAPAWALCWYWVLCLAWLAVRHSEPARAAEFGYFTAAFVLFYAWLVWWSVRQRRALRSLDLWVLVANPAGYFVACYLLLDPVAHAYMGLFAVMLTMAHLALAKLLWNPGAASVRDPRPGMLALGVALVCFTLAVPIQFTGFSITIAWAVEGAALAWLSARYPSDRTSIAAVVVLAIGLVDLFDTNQYDDTLALPTIANLRFVTYAVMAASLFVTAKLLRERPRATAAYVTGHVVVLVALGLEIAGWAERSVAAAHRFEVATVAISIMMALYAVMLVTIGVIRRAALNRILGLFLMGIVVGKLYISDVWELGRAFRIAAFLGLGVLLLLVSYLYSRYRSVIERLWKDA